MYNSFVIKLKSCFEMSFFELVIGLFLPVHALVLSVLDFGFRLFLFLFILLLSLFLRTCSNEVRPLLRGLLSLVSLLSLMLVLPLSLPLVSIWLDQRIHEIFMQEVSDSSQKTIIVLPVLRRSIGPPRRLLLFS